MDWADAQKQRPLYLNLGGRNHCHPHSKYQNYFSVDLEPGEGWHLVHDLTKPMPLPDSSTDRIHTEDALHYLEKSDIETLFAECHRLLKPGGHMRIGVTDYNHPKDRFCLKLGTDPRHARHKTLTTKPLMESLLQKSPFQKYEFFHYWDGDAFTEKPIDYSLGWINRTPEHDPRCKRIRLKGYLNNALLMLKSGFRLSKTDHAMLEGNHLFVTSLVVDCIK